MDGSSINPWRGFFMANRDIVDGFRPYGEALRLRPYVASGVVYPGSLVKQEGGGRVEEAAASNPCIGVASEYASGAGVTIMIWDHPDQEFVGQADGADIDAQTDLGLNYNFVVSAGNATYKRSGMEIDSDTGATNSNYPLKVLRLHPAIDNEFGANAKCIFKINNHQLGQGTGTAGV
jgi:hypothetical protein